MTLNTKAHIPPIEVLYASRAGVVREMARRRSPKAKDKLLVIFNELTFIIENV